MVEVSVDENINVYDLDTLRIERIKVNNETYFVRDMNLADLFEDTPPKKYEPLTKGHAQYSGDFFTQTGEPGPAEDPDETTTLRGRLERKLFGESGKSRDKKIAKGKNRTETPDEPLDFSV